MQYVIGITSVIVRWTHYDRWSAHNLINNIICNYLLLSLVINIYVMVTTSVSPAVASPSKYLHRGTK